METNKPLRGTKLAIFAILFAGAMLYIGYPLLIKNNGKNELNDINNSITEQEAKKHFDSGMDYYTQGNYQKAIPEFKTAVDKGYKFAYALLGESELHIKDLDAAERYLLKALTVKDGENALGGYFRGVEFNLGLLYYMKHNKQLAITHFEKAKDLGHKEADEYLTKLNNM